jgi:hydroxymethylpyrimidine/phosphomethylpyrimidine kinase
MTITWGAKEAVKEVGKTPDVIYHRGDIGKEPMIVILGQEAYDLAKLTIQLARRVENK